MPEPSKGLRNRPVSRRAPEGPSMSGRILFVAVAFGVVGLLIVGRFFQLQVLEHETYQVLASDQHETTASLIPRRGTIFVREELPEG
jgi:cell division protein FtsI/penicillin-binding protein 2